MTKVMTSLPTSLLTFLAIEWMDMGDREGFKSRFKAYKEGKPISEIYDAGLPRYAESTELPIEQMMPYILAVENPTKQGLANGVWRPPTDSSKWDTHAIGGGLDIREENNPIVYNYLKSKGRLNNPYLTVAEEEMLRKQTFEKTTLPALRKMYGKYKDKISEKGYARLAGMKWQGHPYLMAITPDSITGKAFLNAVASGDRDLDSVFDAYYKYPSNAKRYGARINADVNYWKNYSTSSNVEPKSELVQLLEQQDKEKFQPWSNYHSPDYSLSNPAPSTISSWNNPTSPAFNTSGLYARRATNNINNVVQDVLFNDKDVQDALIDNLSNNVFGGKRLGFKNGKLPKYGDGKIEHNVSHAKMNDDDTFTDDYTKLFEDMYVTPYKTDLKSGSYTLNNFPHYLQHRTDWTKPFMSSGTNETGLELVNPEFDILLGGRQLATEIFKPFSKNANEIAANEIAKELNRGIEQNTILRNYNKIPANKDIGSAYDYLDFLDNIYPNSKINGVFYHGGPKGIQKFKSAKELGGTNKNINSGTKSHGIYFADDEGLAQYYAQGFKKRNREVYSVRVNAESPIRYETNNWYLDKFVGNEDLRFRPGSITDKWYDKLDLKTKDAIYHTKSSNSLENGELVIFDGDNIHIMGTPKESEAFRQWKQNPIYAHKPIQDQIPLLPQQYDKSLKNYARASVPGLFLGGITISPYLLYLYEKNRRKRYKQDDSVKHTTLKYKQITK